TETGAICPKLFTIMVRASGSGLVSAPRHAWPGSRRRGGGGQERAGRAREPARRERRARPTDPQRGAEQHVLVRFEEGGKARVEVGPVRAKAHPADMGRIRRACLP